MMQWLKSFPLYPHLRAGRDMLSPFNPFRSSSNSQRAITYTPRAPKKAASFCLLSVCETRRRPSRGPPRRAPNTPSARSPWLAPSRRRSSFSNLESRIKSFRAPPSSSLSQDRPPSSTSVPSNLDDLISSAAPPVTFPVVSVLSRPTESRQISVTARARRVPSSSRFPQLHIDSSQTMYTMELSLPSAITAEMVTISTAKGDELRIVADAWHLESDCHYEWEVAFPPKDVNMGSVCAKLDGEGRLSVKASRY